MRLARVFAGLAILGTAMLVFTPGLVGQQAKEKAPPGKVTGQLPQGWKDLNLSAAQKEDVYKINADYKMKIDKLKAEIDTLQAEQAGKRLRVLNEEQRKKLRDSVGGEATDPKEKAKEKPKE